MTALIGRVPSMEPSTIPIVQGADRPGQPHANGIDIPDVAGAVVSGTASGDWTLSCVRGQIRSVVYRVRTAPSARCRRTK